MPTDRRTAEEILAAEAKHALRMAPSTPSNVWLNGWFNAVAQEYPHLRTPEHRARFIELARMES